MVIDSEGYLRIIDFGSAKFLEDDQTLDESAGTPYIMAPELLQINPSGGRCFPRHDRGVSTT